MKKYLDKLRLKVKVNKNLFVFLLVFILVGVASGAVFSSVLNKADSKMVSDYLNNFMKMIENNKPLLKESFINTSLINIGVSLLIWILGISLVGILLVLPILFIKSFILGFTIGSIINNFNFKGILISFIYVVPHQIVNIFTYMIVCAYAIIISYRLFECVRKKKVLDFKKIMNRYSFILFFSLIVLFITSLYEVFILPSIMKYMIKILK